MFGHDHCITIRRRVYTRSLRCERREYYLQLATEGPIANCAPHKAEYCRWLIEVASREDRGQLGSLKELNGV
jgi:hypothetical protein